MAVDKVGAYVSMGRERELQRRAAGQITDAEDGTWVYDTGELVRTYEVIGFDEETQSTRLLVIAEVRRGDQ